VSFGIDFRLRRMISLLDDRLLFQDDLKAVKEMRHWVLDAEHILSADFVPEGSSVTNVVVAQRFDTWRETLAHQLTEDVHNTQHQQCLEQFLQVLSNQRSHLIQCYDHQDFPRTNNEMERRIRGFKTRYRRISGRKNWNNYLLRYGRYVAYYDWWEQDVQRSGQFLYQAAHLDRADWQQQRRQSQTARSTLLKRFRFCHKRQMFLASLEARWNTGAPT
jgi:hypothetical protein